MVVEHNIYTTSLPILTDGSSDKEKRVRKNVRFIYNISSFAFQYTLNDYIKYIDNNCFQNRSSKRCKSCYYICLGSLVNTIHMQIEKKYTQKDYLYLIGSRYIKDLYKWVQQYKYKELLANDFFKSFVTSVALFVVGVKLTSELTGLKVF